MSSAMPSAEPNPAQALAGSCPLSAALEIMGERWAFLILRGAFNGIRHFEEFQGTLGIARNILSNRLGRLTERGIMERRPHPEDRRKISYKLTDKGLALLPVLVALWQWGEQWECGEGEIALVDRSDERPIEPVTMRAHDGRALTVRDIKWVARMKAAA